MSKGPSVLSSLGIHGRLSPLQSLGSVAYLKAIGLPVGPGFAAMTHREHPPQVIVFKILTVHALPANESQPIR